MATYTSTAVVAGNWLKWEEDGWVSRASAPLAANSGTVLSGTVMKLSGGKLSPMLTGEGGSAAGLLFETKANSTADQPATYIARHAVVADKAITWAAGVLTADKTAAIAALEAKMILVREAV